MKDDGGAWRILLLLLLSVIIPACIAFVVMTWL